MKRKYEGLIVLNTRGKDDTVDTMVSKIGQDLEGEGVSLKQIDHVGKKKFPYGSKKLDEGYYVNYIFEAEPQVIDKLRSKLRLNLDVHQQHYQLLK